MQTFSPYFLFQPTRLFPAQLPSNNSLLQVSRNFWWRLCLVRELAIVLNSSRHTFKSFECSFITLQLASDTLTVFNIYRPPTSSNYSQKPSVFLDEFASLLSLAATTP